VKVSVDREICVASGACVLECPEVFGQDDEGLVVLLDSEPPEELHENVRNAENACPAAVITID